VISIGSQVVQEVECISMITGLSVEEIMNTVSMIIGIALVILSASLWFCHWYSYIRVRQPFNRASGYQIILITFTAIGLLLGCH
jgi:hypothetical protein